MRKVAQSMVANARSRNAPASGDALDATRALLRRFRSQRPLRGGSLLLTIFGDAIAPRGGVATLGSLIRLAAPFGLTERLVRTSMARLAQDGWLGARRDGRLSEYGLTPSGAQRFAEATHRIYSQGPASWDGNWTMLIASATSGERRERLREELRWRGFGEITAGVYAHPACSIEQARQWLQEIQGARAGVLLRSSTGELTADRELVAAGWDLQELTRRYRRFLDAFRAVESAIASPAAGAAALDPESSFIVRTLLIHEYRKIHLQDPLLPPALLPEGWVGAAAYDLCRGLYARVFDGAEEYLSSTASTLDHPLPPADAAAYERFGGIRRANQLQAERSQ
ncbi:MAG TPA: PaaX family transcriptional regulator C-terminal domain-containing protein [Steroidobacteraceae bacterium]|nr:PaaX family transcriptional regulator C-terminal domain-containing protein [Steroidobacteraceae bacterium]